jgi:hypothetical protein
VLHIGGTWLALWLPAVARTSGRPSVAPDLPPQSYSLQSKAGLAHLLIYLEGLLDCLADDIIAETSQIQRCWDRYYGHPGVSTATELIDWLGRAFDDVTTLDRAIHGEASGLIANYRAYRDEIDWLIGFRAHSPHSHAVPHLRSSLVRFRDEMVLAREDDCDDAESFKKILENMWSKLDAFQTSRQDFRTWVGETRVRTEALRMALVAAAAQPVRQADEHRTLAGNPSRDLPEAGAWTKSATLTR